MNEGAMSQVHEVKTLWWFVRDLSSLKGVVDKNLLQVGLMGWEVSLQGTLLILPKFICNSPRRQHWQGHHPFR